MLKQLGKEERLQLMKFICSFVWADLRVHDKERNFVHKMVKKLSLGDKELALVERWLEVPPKPHEVDPNQVPAAHRGLFLATIREVIEADGEVDPEEQINFALLEELLGPDVAS
jgi:uncharacterized tellurite resistance protein B-like protein